MAALGTIRKRGITLVIIIGLGLFAFIAEETVRSCEAYGNERNQQVGEVLGEKVSVQKFQSLVDEYQEVIKLTQGRDNLTDEELNGLKDQVWKTFVNNTIIRKEAEKLGLTVTDAELQNVLREGTNPILLNSPFVNQQTKRFDATLLTKFLAEYKKNVNTMEPQMQEYYQRIYTFWQFIEKTLREQLLATKYQTLLAGSLLTNPVSVKAAIANQNEESDILLASAAYKGINDNDVKIEQSDYKAKYNEMKGMFEQYVESRDIKYVDFQVLPSAADRNALMETMKKASEELKAGGEPTAILRKAQSQFAYTGVAVSGKALPRDIASRIDSMSVGETTLPFETTYDNTLNVVKLIAKTELPDSVEYRAIQVPGASLEAARTTADSIYNALQAGADFEALAKKYGQTGAKQWMTTAQYENSTTVDADTKNYIETLNTTAVGQTKNLAFTQGNVIVQITDRRHNITKYVTAIVKHTIDFSKDTYSAAYNKFSQFVSESQTLEALEKNAAKYGFKVIEHKDLYNSEHYIAGIRSTRDAMKWVFESKENQLSPLYECGNNDHLLVVALTKIHKVGYRDLEDVKDMLTPAIMRDKKFEMLSKKFTGIKNISDALSKGMAVDTVNQITFNSPAFIQSVGGIEPSLSGAVAATKQGEFSKSLVKGNAGAYLFQVLKKSERANALKDTKVIENQLRQQATQMVLSRVLDELYINSKVVDKRYLFF